MEKFVKEKRNIILKIAALVLLLLVAVVSVVKVSTKKTASVDAETRRSQDYAQLVDDRAHYIDEDDEDIGSCEYVKFAAFYPKDIDGDGTAEKSLGKCSRIGTTDILYVDIGVEQQGYLKNATITLQGSNVYYAMNNYKDTVLAENCIFSQKTSRIIQLNKLDPNMGELLEISTSAKITNENYYTKTNKVILSGTYVDSNDEEHEVKKVIELTNDWYGIAKAELSELNNTIEFNKYKEQEDKSIEFSFKISELYKELIPEDVHIELDVVELAGEYPLDVICEDGTYNQARHKLVIDRDTNKSTEEFHVKLIYPDEVYNTIIEDTSYNSYKMIMPVSGFYDCYNNDNEEFDNPYTSAAMSSKVYINFILKNGGGQDYEFSTSILGAQYVREPNSSKTKRTMSKDPIMVAYDTEDEVENMEYSVEWYVGRKLEISSDKLGIIMKDPKVNEPYGDTLASVYLDDLEGLELQNRISYGRIKSIYFSNSAFIPTDGYVDVFDNDTDELIKRFTYSEVELYSSSGLQYTLNGNVKHIRVETSAVNPKANSVLRVIQVKEIYVDRIEENFRRTQVERMEELKTNIHGGLTNGVVVTGSDVVYLETAKNYASINLNKTTASVEETLNEVITINVPNADTIYSQWKNGIFLIEVPSKIVNMKINNITAGKVTINGYDLDRKDGKYFLKIFTSNDNLTSGFNITIDTDMMIDQKSSSASVPFYLYAYNENSMINYYPTSDRYDLNGDGNTSDLVTSEKAYLGISAASTFITQENLSNYGDGENITIAPNIADILEGRNTATVNVEIVNNHRQTLEDIIVLGKIPFEGNSFIGGVDLGSEFSVTMKDGGIRVPDELKSYAKVYYTSNENPTNDITLASNGWTLAENVSSFSSVKCYLIILDGYALNSHYGYEFSYDVNIPENVTINSTAYSCHIVYYSLVTEEGKIESTKQPAKLGMRIVNYYDLELDKVKENTAHTIQGATYKVTEVLPASADQNIVPETHIAISGSDGKIVFSDLRVNQQYTIEEIRAPGNYELSDVVRTFALVENNGVLEFDIDEDFDGDVTITEGVDIGVAVKSKVENTPKIELNITKYDENNDPLGGVVYTINGKRIGTDPRGKIVVNGLSFGQTNTIVETYAKGYYVDETVYQFTVNKDARNNITIDSTNENFRNAIIENSDTADLVKVAVTLTNEKIPTYDLKVVKVDESNVSTKLKDARFLIRKVDDETSVIVSTDNNGEATLDDLYQYVEGKNITGKYVLQEFEAPSGYSLNDEEVKFHVEKDGNDELQVIFEEGSGSTVYSAEFVNDTLVITIKDRPMFKIKKVDVETREPLAYAQFSIYQVNDQGSIGDFARDASGELIGVQNENGYWVVTTDENGYLTAPLPNGTYKVVEVKAPTGYALYTGAEIITIAEGNRWNIKYVPPKKVNAIYTIEDLVDFSLSTNLGAESYEGETVRLMNSLDFNDDSSYANPNSDYGDINQDGINEGLKAELTKTREGRGFTPISSGAIPFKGTFDGQGYDIRNINIKSTLGKVGLFGSVEQATIKNVCISSGSIQSTFLSDGCAIGGIVGTARNTEIYNCYNKASISAGSTHYNGSVGGILGDTTGSVNINNCYNKGSLSASKISTYFFHIRMGGIAGNGGSGASNPSINNVSVSNSYSTGDIYSECVGGTYTAIYPIANGNITNCYYLSSSSIPATGNNGSVAKTEEEMKDAAFVETLGSDNWKIDENNENTGYPVLKYSDDEEEEPQAEKTVEIYKIEDLVNVALQSARGESYQGYTIYLMNDVDFEDDNSYRDVNDSSFGDINLDGTVEGIKAELTNTNGNGFIPIGGYNQFMGNFDGKGYEIKNIYINSSVSYKGLFGNIYDSKISNIKVSGNIKAKAGSSSSYMGGICGYALQNSIIANCSSNVKLENETNNSYYIYTGGIAGYLSSSSVINSYNTGNISSSGIYNGGSSYSEYTGGIVGLGYKGKVYNSYNRGNIEIRTLSSNVSASSYNIYASGIGYTGYDGKISNTYTTGNITYDNSIDSIIKVGYISSAASGSYSVEQSFYLDSAQINPNYNDGSVAKDMVTMKSAGFVELLGSRNWSMDTNNVNDGYPIINADFSINEINNIEDLMVLSKVVNMGMTFSEDKPIKLNKTLDFKEDSSYNNPNDISFGDINGDGNVTGIKDELTDENGKGFIPIGNYGYDVWFTGVFDGQNNEIKNLYINRTDSVYNGLFGSAKDARILNVTVDGDILTGSESGGICGYVHNSIYIENCHNKCNIISTGSNFGGIIGKYSPNSPTNTPKLIVKGCSNSGNISGRDDLGGIIGYIPNNLSKVELIDCQNNGNITGTEEEIGGIIGWSAFTNIRVEGCSNSKKIEGSGEVGGIIGLHYGGTLINCNNSGDVSSRGYTGGIIGNTYNNRSIIIGCSNSGRLNGNNVAGIVGNASTYLDISYCSNTGDIGSIESGSYIVAGIVGYNNAGHQIVNCYNLGNLYNATYIGGIAGDVGYCGVLNSYNKGNIIINSNYSTSSTRYIGGIVAFNPSSTVAYCYNSGAIDCSGITSYTYIGGIAGYGKADHSFNKANINAQGGVNSSGYVGGVIGYGDSVGYCYNTGNICVTDFYSSIMCGGVAGQPSNGAGYCYNNGDISVDTSSNSNYVGGINGYGTASYSYNDGNIETQLNGSSNYVGGVSGSNSSGSIYCCYNNGQLYNVTETSSNSYVYVGGILAYQSCSVACAYNTGDIDNKVIATSNNSVSSYVGGISGYLASSGTTANVYNTGNVINIVPEVYSNAGTGPIIGAKYSTANDLGSKRYYLYGIEVIGPNMYDYNSTAVSDDELKSEELYQSIRVTNDSTGAVCENWRKVEGGYPILDIPVYAETNESDVEITVEDKKLEFNITAEVGENINGVRTGGDVSGIYNDKYTSSSHKKYIETVNYGETSTEPIVITPDTGYQVANVLIDGEFRTFDADVNGVVTIPAGYFKNITKNINVVATFAPIEEMLVINKVDENNNPVEGAVFEVHQVENRENPTNVIGEIVNDGVEESYTSDVETTDAISIGQKVNYGSHGFTVQSDGSFVSTNNGIHNSYSTAYIPIDLTQSEKDYYVSVNYKISSEGCDYGLIYVKDNTTSIVNDASGTNLLYKGGISEGYTSTAKLEKGKINYIHMGYKKDGSVNTNDDKFTVKSFKFYERESRTAGPFNFQNVNGKYVSDNYEQIDISTYATSVIPVDLTGKTGKYNIIVNNEIYGSNHYGCVFINKSSARKTGYNTSSGDIVITPNKSNTSAAENNSAVVEGGDMYYIHLVHCNYGSSSNPLQDNSFTINSVNVTLNTDDFINVTGIVTSESGKANVNVPYGKYEIYETLAPEQYTKSDEHKIHVIGDGTTNNLTFVNETKKKVVAHYYLENTGAEYGVPAVEVSDDEELFGDLNTDYETHVYPTIDDYELIKDNEDEYIIPDNATGKFESNVIDVYFYYENNAPYRVHYVYDGEEDADALVEGEATVGTEITTFEQKDKDGYSFREAMNFPLTISKNTRGTNDIYVMYDRNSYEYKIKYYYENVDGTYEEDTESEVTGSAPYESEIYDYEDKCPVGFKFNRAVVSDGTRAEKELPLIVGTDPLKNVIKVYYDRNEYNYTVHYFYSGVENSQMMETASARYESEISEYIDKNINGYKLDKAKALNDQGEEINLPLVIGVDESKNVINVYYVKDNFGYSIEYYYDNVKDAEKTVTGTAEFESVIDSYTDKNIDGYKFDKTENKPLTITSNAANNVMKVYYVKDNFGYSIEYYYDNVKDAEKTVTGTAEFASVIDSYEDKNIDGYKLDRTENKPLTITSNTANNVMKVYYVKDNFGYSIEYYYDNVKDAEKTVTGTAEFASVIDSYTDKNIDGYKFDKTENKPMTITSNAANNVMKVYYVKDNFGYSIEYYYDNVKDAEKTVTGTAEFASVIDSYTDKNIDGYKLDRTENKPLTITSNAANNVMKVYYVKDNFGYSIEYYYDNVKDAEKTVIGTAEFASVIDNYEDKNIDGYKLDRTENKPLTITSNAANNVMKVYYVKDNFGYSIEYYYDNVKDAEKTVTGTAEFASVIDSYEDKNIDGYKLDRTENKPLTITSNTANNVMKVYYVKDNFGYSIEYYYDNVKDAEKTVTGTAEFASVIDNYEDKNIDGYKLDRTENKPMTITSNTANNVMKVYYIKDNFGYSIEYYYDNVKDAEKTVTGTAEFASVIDSYEDKNIDGYKLDRTENKPMTITSNAANNVMKVYYVKDNFGYSIEYYYDNVKDAEKTVTGTAEFASVIDNYEDKNIDGYKLDRTENKPMTITSNAANNVMKVYYVKDTFAYEIHYYYEGVEDTTKAETGLSAVFGTSISDYTDKNIPGYKLEKTRALDENGDEGPLPLIIKSDVSNNRINVYYIKDALGYEVHYFYDGVENASLRESANSTIGEQIENYVEKSIDGYKFEKARALDNNGDEGPLPLVIKADTTKNIINVYYVKDNFGYSIEYYYDNVKDDEKTVTGTAEFASVIDSYEDKNIDGYKFDKTENKPMTITSNVANNVMKVYYVKDNFGYSIEYYYDNVKDAEKTVTGTAEFGSVIDSYSDKNIDGYKFDKTENKPMTITSNAANNVMKVYYVKDNFEYSIEYYYDNVKDAEKTVTGTAEFGSVIDSYADKNIDGYRFDKTENKPLTITSIAEDNVMKVYYVKDNFSYSIEYYYDNVKDAEKTVSGRATFGSVIEDYEDKVIDGYKFDKTENKPLTVTSNAANNVMKVYYVKDDFAYSVEYYYGGVIDDSKTETGTAKFGSTVSDYEAKPIDGYKFSTAKALDENGVEGELPLTIKSDVNKNKIRVYYIKDNFGYSIEYYYDNVKDADKTVTGTAEFGSTINNYDDKNIDGYKFEKTENKPMTITSNAANNVMKVYYVKDTFGYSIEYYYDNVKNEDKTVTDTALLGTVIDEYEDKNIDGYELDKTENKPMTITSTVANNVMKVFYKKASFNYEVHYFYENGENSYAEDESKAELTNSAVFGSEITTYTGKVKPGFKFEKAKALKADGSEGEMPLVIKSDETKNKINVYYIKDELGYEIHYFYENLNGEFQEDTAKKENKNSTIGEEISTYPEKAVEGFELDRAKAIDDNGDEAELPLIIKADETKNIINVYYKRSNFNYTVHYFIDGVENTSLKETSSAKFGRSISSYTDKCPGGYELIKARALNDNGEEEELPLIIKADESKNVINVYYEKIIIPIGKVYVEYVDNLTGEEINPSTLLEGEIGTNYGVDRVVIPGYRLDEDNLPDNETGIFKADDQTVTYTYIELRPYELEVRYTAGEDEIEEAKLAVEYGGVDGEGQPVHRIENYTTNGILKISDIELTDLGTETYTVYETETPEYCKTVVSKENPGVVELRRILNTEKNKYEFVPVYEEKDGFKVVIDEVNKKVIIDITTKKEEKYDLAIKKFISNINGTAITDREPEVTVSEDGKVSYKTNDTIEKTANKQNITYTIRMYNESEVRAKGKRVIEYIPDGLVFVPDNEINTKYGWNMFKATENGNLVVTNNPEEANVVATDYLVGKNIDALHIADENNPEDESRVSSLDVEVLFRVDESRITSTDRIIENKVQIMPNKNDDNTENDETSEKVYVQFFDLDIEKYIETVKIENKEGTEERNYGYDRRGELVKIDVKKSLVNSTKITVTYGLLVKNVGEIPGYATEIEDIMPEGFKLVENDAWTMDGERAVTTSLSEVKLEPGESTVVNVTFEWKLSESTIGLKSNEAHIAKYENEFDAKDLTEDNRGKQDMLVSIKTGSEVIIYVTIALGFTMILAAGTAVVRRKTK